MDIPVRFIGTSRSAVTAARELSGALNGAGAAAGRMSVEQRRANAAVMQGRGSMSSLRSTVMGLAGAYVGTVGLMYSVRAVVDEEKEYQAVNAQTRAALKSTGGIAGVTQKHVRSLADQLMHLSGIDDELVQKGENVVLMFDQVRNVAGKGNDIFDQTVRLAADLSKRLGLDVTGAARVLARALQDPMKGVTQLRRANIVLVQSEVDAVKAAMRHGDVLKAQQIILNRVRVQVGGAAEAYGKTLPGQIDRSREALRNFGRDVLNSLAPTGDFADAVERWTANEENVRRITADLRTFVRVVKGGFDALVNIVKSVDRFTGGFENTVKLLIGLKVASWLAGFTGGLGGVTGKLGGEAGAVGLSGAFLGNMQRLAKMGIVTVGIATMFAGIAGTGTKAFVESIVGAAATGWVIGGPQGAMFTVLAAISFKVLPNIPKWLQDIMGGKTAFDTQVAQQQADAFLAQLRQGGKGQGVDWIKERIDAMKQLGNTSNDTYRILVELLQLLQSRGKNAALTAADIAKAIRDVQGATQQRPGAGTGGQANVTGKGWVFPFPGGPTKYKPGQGPYQPGSTHAQKDWQSGNAIDIAAKPWTPVLSPVNGHVTNVSGQNATIRTATGKVLIGYGISISGEGQNFYIAHMLDVQFPMGAQMTPVRRGEVIGYVDPDAGHVHFAVEHGSPQAIFLGATGTGVKTPSKTGAKRPTTKPTDKPKFTTEPSAATGLALSQAREAFMLHPGVQTLEALRKADDAAIAELNKRMKGATKQQQAQLIDTRTTYEQEKKQAAEQLQKKTVDVTALPYVQGRELKLAEQAASLNPSVATLTRLIALDDEAIKTLKSRVKKAAAKQRQDIQDAIDELVGKRKQSAKDLADLKTSLAQPTQEARLSLSQALADVLGTGTPGLGELGGWASDASGLRDQLAKLKGTLSTRGEQAFTALKGLWQKLSDKTLSKAAIASIQKQIEKWGLVWDDELQKSVNKATWAAEDAATSLSRSLRDVGAQVQRAFDRVTSDYEDAFNDETDSVVQSMQDAAQAQADALQIVVKSAYGDFLYGGEVTQTPAEKMLAELDAAMTKAEQAWSEADARRAVAKAVAAGDAVGAQQAQRELERQLDEQKRTQLQTRAEAERDAADKQLDEAKTVLEKRLDAEMEAYRRSRSQRLRAYEQERQDQWTHLSDMLGDQETLLGRGLISWADYVTNVNGILASLGLPGVAVNADGGAAGGGTGGDGFLPGSPNIPQPGHPIYLAAGGRVPGTYVGKLDTVAAQLTPGETVIDRKLTQALEAFLAAPTGGATFIFNGHVWDRRQLMRDIRDDLIAAGEWKPGKRSLGGR